MAYEVFDASDTDAHRTADAMQRGFLAEQAFYQSLLFCAHYAIVRVEDKLPATRFAAMVLLPIVNMTIFLEALGATRWTRLSHDHNCLHPPWYRLVILINHTMGL